MRKGRKGRKVKRSCPSCPPAWETFKNISRFVSNYEIKSPTIDEGYGVLSVLEKISVVLTPNSREKSNGPVTKQVAI